MTIQQHSMTTKKGNTLSFFYNDENNLLVVDLIHSSECGGKEIVRITLKEKELLKHAIKLDLMYKKLTEGAEAVKGIPLKDLNLGQLCTLLAYHYWQDGADLEVVEETWKSTDINEEVIKNTLKQTFGYEI